jgi:hypothetical protein
MKLDLHKLISGPECKHDAASVSDISARLIILKKYINAILKFIKTCRYCNIFPSINVKGVVRHLQLRKGELVTYAEQCEKILKRYVKRLQWLLSGT